MDLTMTNVKSRSRRDKSQATRRAIIGAARDEFIQHGFHGATITQIASRAGVAAQTVYFVFHSKPELISAVIDASVMGDHEPVAPQESDWWTTMSSEPRADEALRVFVRGAAPLFARASAISEILRAAALTDDEVRRTHQFHENLRANAFGQVVEVLRATGQLRAGLTAATATDILLTVFSDSTYQALTTERAWTHDQIIDWFCLALPGLLLAPDAT